MVLRSADGPSRRAGIETIAAIFTDGWDLCPHFLRIVQKKKKVSAECEFESFVWHCSQVS